MVSIPREQPFCPAIQKRFRPDSSFQEPTHKASAQAASPQDQLQTSQQGRAHTDVSFAEGHEQVERGEKKGFFKKWGLPIGTGIGGAVMGFFLGGPPGAIVGAAVGAGVGFLLPKVFEGVSKLLKWGLSLGEDKEPAFPKGQTPMMQDAEIFNQSPDDFAPENFRAPQFNQSDQAESHEHTHEDSPTVYHQPQFRSAQEAPPTPETPEDPTNYRLEENPETLPIPQTQHRPKDDFYSEADINELSRIRGQGHDHYRQGPSRYGYYHRAYQNINRLDGGKHTSSGQTHYPPTGSGNGNGKNAYFFIGFTGSRKDQGMRQDVEPFLVDDIQRLRENGYQVIVDTRGTKAAFQAAVDDDNNAGIFWAGHGMPQGIQDSRSGQFFRPQDIQPNPNSQLRYCIFETCLAGQNEKAWENRLGTDVMAHNRVIYQTEIMEFADPDKYDNNELDDIIGRRLIQEPWN